MYNHKDRYSFFNILRILASIAIALFLHFRFHLLRPLQLEGNPFMKSRLLWFLSNNSTVFVELFFIISGILFVLVYLPRIKEKKYTLDSFFLHRVIRLCPLAAITSIFVFIVQVLLYHGGYGLYDEKGSVNLVGLAVDILFSGKRVFNATSTNNMSIWYINVLILCSVIAYGLSVLYTKYPNKLMFGIPLFLGISIMYQDINYMFLNPSVARGLVAFFEGCLIEFCMEDFNDELGRMKIPISIVAVLILAISIWLIIYKKSGYEPYIKNLYLYFDFYVYPSLILLLYNIDSINYICSTKIFKFFSDISFGIYLWNIPIYSIVYLVIKVTGITNNVLQQYIMPLWLLLFVVHVIVAILSFYIIEKPLTNRLTSFFEAKA